MHCSWRVAVPPSLKERICFCTRVAGVCTKLVGARLSIPYHMAPGKLFDQGRAELFDVPDRLIVPAGEEIILEKVRTTT